MAVVEWGPSQRKEVQTVDQLDALLDAVASKARSQAMPQNVQVTVGDAGTLSVVVGADRSVLNHVPSHLGPPYMISLGEEAGDEPFVFYVAGDHYSEVRWRNTIHLDPARDAIRRFLRTGELSADVEWEEG